MRKMLNHEHDIIDVLKFDIEDGEYQIFNQLIESGILQDIKLVSFELHLGHMKILENADTGLLIYRALKVAFEKNNFKLWRWHENESMAKQHPENAYCWTEVYWINMKFVKNKK
uniref:Uncharacterized protein LOC102808984 n=1 Tax=Saccoglossus kowalevskii TaxID=10224 RepID=A0ABM0M1W9_SACKO|nr:PREDICTED: uncharacterized protein LOC102808984 [Saccoglossus kowalevskii]